MENDAEQSISPKTKWSEVRIFIDFFGFRIETVSFSFRFVFAQTYSYRTENTEAI